MKKDYCTQNNGDCATCSLVNYGRDCRNNPISSPPPKPKKLRGWAAAISEYKGFQGEQTINHIMKHIPKCLQERLTGTELGMVMNAVNAAYHDGKASCGAEVIDGEAIWINKLDRLFELEDIARLKRTTEKTREYVRINYPPQHTENHYILVDGEYKNIGFQGDAYPYYAKGVPVFVIEETEKTTLTIE